MALAATAAVSALSAAGSAWAANGAYAVDAADISEVGSCKVESWISTATNTDFSAVANPSCVANIYKPVELSLQTVVAGRVHRREKVDRIVSLVGSDLVQHLVVEGAEVAQGGSVIGAVTRNALKRQRSRHIHVDNAH